MEIIEIACDNLVFRIRKDIIVYVLSKVTGKDFSSKSENKILKAMEEYCLVELKTLKSMEQASSRHKLLHKHI